MLSDAELIALRRGLRRRGKMLLSCEASAALVARSRGEGSPEIAREFFNALGIYRDPMKAMG